jgi:hypothetical protein
MTMSLWSMDHEANTCAFGEGRLSYFEGTCTVGMERRDQKENSSQARDGAEDRLSWQKHSLS